jgi:predicted transcriptional regulator
MRQITPQSLYDQVLLLDKGESAWRSFLRHKNEDDIHVIVLDAEGHIVYRHEGPFSEGAYRAVKPHLQQLEQLAGQPGAPPSASAQ